MTNAIKQRRQSETSKILAKLADRNESVNVTTNNRINKILNSEFAQRAQLAEARKTNQDRINQLNNDYVRATQDVLDDQTLQFLVEHSKIDAPTLTSIFAGFELAKASRAKKLNEQRQADVQAVERLNDINQQVSEARSLQASEQINDTRTQQAQDIRTNERAADALNRAAQNDIQAGERRQEIVEDRAIRRTERTEDAELERDLQNIRSNRGPNNQLALFRSLQGGSNATGQPATGAVNPTGTANPITSVAQPGSPSPVPQQVQTTTVTPIDADSELTDQEILLLNFDRNILAQNDPQNIFTSPLTAGNTGANLSESERRFLAGVREQGGAESVIQTLNVNNDFNIGQPQNLLTDAERSLLNLNRTFNNDDNLGNPAIVNEFGDLTSEEEALVLDLRERNLVGEDLGRDEFDELVEFRTGRDGEVIPVGRTFADLDENDQEFVTRRRLENLDVPAFTVPTEDTTNSATADDTLLLNQEVVNQIDILNEREDVDALDPVEIQRSLLQQDIDVANLTIDEFNRLIKEGQL